MQSLDNTVALYEFLGAPSYAAQRFARLLELDGYSDADAVALVTDWALQPYPIDPYARYGGSWIVAAFAPPRAWIILRRLESVGDI